MTREYERALTESEKRILRKQIEETKSSIPKDVGLIILKVLFLTIFGVLLYFFPKIWLIIILLILSFFMLWLLYYEIPDLTRLPKFLKKEEKVIKNGTFEYQYHQDILGSGALKGVYEKIGDTLKLNLDKVLYAAKSKIIEKEDKNSDSTKIEIKFQRLAENGKTDIENWDWYVSINNAEFIKTNENGVLTIPSAKNGHSRSKRKK